jgi:Secretion system C-terminal sorting domain
MKKQLLFISAVTLGFCMNAQNRASSKTASYVRPVAEIENNQNSFVNQVANAAKANVVINDVVIGHSANSLGFGFARRAPLHTMPSLNTVVLTHRVNVAFTPAATNSGNFSHDYSTNNGTSFTNDLGPVYLPAGGVNGRYPSGVTSNPTGNTTPTNATVYYAGPGLSGGAFAAIVYGSHAVGAATGSSFSVVQDSTTNTLTGFPYGMAVNSTGNALFPVAVTNDMTSTTIGVKAIRLFKLSGTGASTALSFIDLPNNIKPLGDIQCRIAFAPNGTTGFVSYQGDDSATALLPGNDRIRIYMTKTTDGGATWSNWNKIDLNTLPQLDSLDDIENAPFDSTDVTTDFAHDLTVDANGNPYIFTALAKANKFSTGNYSTPTSSAIRGAYVIYSTNGGTSYSAHFAGRVESLRNESVAGATPVSHDNNQTASRNAAGTTLAFGMLDTRDGLDSTNANDAPDLMLLSCNTSGATPVFSPWVNATDGSAQAGTVDYGQGANFLLANGDYPFAWQEAGLDASFAKDGGLAATLHYINGISLPTGLSKYKTGFDLVQLFPNPTKGILNLKVGNAAKNVSVEFVNLVGQTVYTSKVAIGTTKLDLTSLNAGVYFANINVDGVKTTKKIVVE